MFKLKSLLYVAVILLTGVSKGASATAPAHLYPHAVYLRVEGIVETFFEHIVRFPYPRNISTPSSDGSFPCTGTNLGANPSPGPTLTTALAQAVKYRSTHGNPLGFDAIYDSAREEFFVTTIGTDRAEGDEFWVPLLNFQIAPDTGCKQEVNRLDHVLWYLMTDSTFGPALKLEGTHHAVAGKPFTLKVLDGGNGMPFEGGVIGPAGPVLGSGSGPMSDENGHVKVTEPMSGVFTYKARTNGAFRSNQHVVTVT